MKVYILCKDEEILEVFEDFLKAEEALKTRAKIMTELGYQITEYPWEVKTKEIYYKIVEKEVK